VLVKTSNIKLIYKENIMEGYIGQLLMFAGNFAPRNWALCDGQLIAISQNQSLYAIIGTTYGGDGRSTFALPDLRGRTSTHPGGGPGLTPVRLGQHGGSEKHTLIEEQMPSHNHQVTARAMCVNGPGNTSTPVENSWSSDAGGTSISYSNLASDTQMNGSTIEVQQESKGENQPINNLPPYLAVNYIICTEGQFPSRN
jgi:microcystin-dependent protein